MTILYKSIYGNISITSKISYLIFYTSIVILSTFNICKGQDFSNVSNIYKYHIQNNDSPTTAIRVKGYSGLFTKLSTFQKQLKPNFSSYTSAKIKPFLFPFARFNKKSIRIVKVNVGYDIAYIQILNSKKNRLISNDIGISKKEANQIFSGGLDSLKDYSELNDAEVMYLIDRFNIQDDINENIYIKSLVKLSTDCIKNPIQYNYKENPNLKRIRKHLEDKNNLKISKYVNSLNKLKVQSYEIYEKILKSLSIIDSLRNENRTHYKLQKVFDILKELRSDSSSKATDITNIQNLLNDLTNEFDIENEIKSILANKFNKFDSYCKKENNSYNNIINDKSKYLNAITYSYFIYKNQIGGKDCSKGFIVYNLFKSSNRKYNESTLVLYIKAIAYWDYINVISPEKFNLTPDYDDLIASLKMKIDTCSEEELLTKEELIIWNKYIDTDFLDDVFKLFEFNKRNINCQMFKNKADKLCREGKIEDAVNSYFQSMRFCCPNNDIYSKAIYLNDTLNYLYKLNIDSADLMRNYAVSRSNTMDKIKAFKKAIEFYNTALLLRNVNRDYPKEKMIECDSILNGLINNKFSALIRLQSLPDFVTREFQKLSLKYGAKQTLQIGVNNNDIESLKRNEISININYGKPIPDSLLLVYGTNFATSQYYNEEIHTASEIVFDFISELTDYLNDLIDYDSSKIILNGQSDAIPYLKRFSFNRNNFPNLSNIGMVTSNHSVNGKNKSLYNFKSLQSLTDHNGALSLARTFSLLNEINSRTVNIKNIIINTNRNTFEKGSSHRYCSMQLVLRLDTSINIDTTKIQSNIIFNDCNISSNNYECRFVDEYVTGKFYAILIAADTFPNRKSGYYPLPLTKMVTDRLYNTLITKCNFEKENIEYLSGLNATEDQILQSIYSTTAKMNKDDNILIYFNGHGEFSSKKNEYFIIPANAKRTNSGIKHGISQNVIIDKIVLSKWINRIKHSLIIVDACQSNYMQQLKKGSPESDVNKTIDQNILLKYYGGQSHTMLTSSWFKYNSKNTNFSDQIISILNNISECGLTTRQLRKDLERGLEIQDSIFKIMFDKPLPDDLSNEQFEPLYENTYNGLYREEWRNHPFSDFVFFRNRLIINK